MYAIEAANVTKVYKGRRGQKPVVAVNDVTLRVAPGQTLGVVGESGSGKSTLGRCLLRLEQVTSGAIRFQGQDITSLSRRQLRQLRSRIQMVFQDPYGSVNPRLTIGEIIEEPLVLHTTDDPQQRRATAIAMLERVGLDRGVLSRFPHQLSGGQLQRVGIARAIATGPAFLVLDEPTASLDVSVRAGVLALLKRLQEELGIAYVLISHDMTTIQSMCSEVVVMYRGTVVERGSPDQVFQAPAHPYTQALLSASLPVDGSAMDGQRLRLLPKTNQADSSTGCALMPRCPIAIPACGQAVPPLQDVSPGHGAACVRVADGSNVLPTKH
jgi:oligopeptide/dipeptide ABC transporter ATP-binding protein